MSRLLVEAVAHGARVRVRAAGAVPGVDEAFVRGLRDELACFPPTGPWSQGLEVLLRGPRRGEDIPGLFAHPGWMRARVTEETLVRWRPDPAIAEVVVFEPPAREELILLVWARVATLLRFLRPPGGGPRASFHAASWAGPQGGVLVLGESGAGKTTSSAALTHGLGARLDYLGDEDAMVELRAGAPTLLALPRRLRLTHLGPFEDAPREAVRAFGEEGWRLDRPAAPRRYEAPLTRVLALRPDPEGPDAVRLEPLVGTAALFALMQAHERFPGDEAGSPGLAARLATCNREGLALAGQVITRVPMQAVRYPGPTALPEVAACLREALLRPSG